MTNLRIIFLLGFIINWAAGTSSWAQRQARQTITYRNFDFVRAVTCSMNYAYFATTGGIIRYDKMQQDWAEPLTSADGMPSEPINLIRSDRFDQILVIETDFGIYEYDDFFQRWNPISELPPIDNDCVHRRAPDVLLPEFDANYMGRGEFADFHGRRFATTDIVDDASGNLWIGTWGFGPARADVSSGLMNLLPYGLIQQRVDLILPDDTVLWIAGALHNDFRSGLTAHNPETNGFLHVESGLNTGLPAVDIFALEADSARLYVGTPLGLYLVEKESGVTRGPISQRGGLAEDVILSLELMEELLFVGTASGLNVIDLVTDSVFHVRSETFQQHVIYDLERVAGTIWIGSSAGAFRYAVESDRLQQFKDPELVLFGSVLDVEHHHGMIWFASDAGVAGLDLTSGETVSFHEPSGLRDQRALAAGDKLVALAADHGLTIIFLDNEKPHSESFTTDDGLASDNVHALRIDGDYLWVGTDNGLTRFLWNDPRWVD